jgi:hypothetical protein
VTPTRRRIRHSLPAARWPTREEAERSRLFSPARIGPLWIEPRTWVPAMVLIDFLAVRRRPEPAVYFDRHLAITPDVRARLAAALRDDGWRTAPEHDVRARLRAADRALVEVVLTARELERASPATSACRACCSTTAARSAGTCPWRRRSGAPCAGAVTPRRS